MLRHLRPFIGKDQVQERLEIDAVENDGRVTPIRFLLAVGGNDLAVVFNRRLRADAADDAYGLHPSAAELALGMDGRGCPSLREL